jgi:hypothetical protein
MLREMTSRAQVWSGVNPLRSIMRTPIERRLPAADESHLLAMDMALNAHGIVHVVHREHGEAATDYIAVHEGDFDRATALVRDLQVTTMGDEPRSRGFIIFSVVATVLVLGGIVLVLLARG